MATNPTDGLDTGASLRDRAGGLRPEPAAQSQPEALILSALDLVPYLPDDLAGEVLRALSFTGEGFGAYANFDVAPFYRALPACELGLPMRTAMLGCYANTPGELRQVSAWVIPGVLRMAWHWDGDGTLVFATKNFMLTNSDCKKDYGWERHSEGDWITKTMTMPGYYEDPPLSPAQGTPTRRAETTGSVGGADGGPVPSGMRPEGPA